MKSKIFQDTVHGSIKIPSKYCDEIVDTFFFQRLRRIEQTSMRSVYPCARHDRFIHSLGTFYLGDKIFENIKDNSADKLRYITNENWTLLGESYKLACLLHDCGHSPFSHTFEKYYDKPAENLNGYLINEVKTHLVGQRTDVFDDFNDDFEVVEPKPHEKVSAIILLKSFGKTLLNFGADPILSARMIIGCLYTNPKSELEKISNCFIKLLNGHIIDADRLDYIKRDKWASGYNSANLDIERLLNSMSIRYDIGTYKICFHKNSISEIPHVIDGRNFQSSWVFSHQKVTYDQLILVRAVETLAKNLNSDLEQGKALSKIFNIDSFFDENYSINDDVMLYMPCDDDIVYLLKNDKDNKYAKEWFSRSHMCKPIWKSYADFCCHFDCVQASKLEENNTLHKAVKPTLERFLRENSCKGDYYIKEFKNKGSDIDRDDIFIEINDKIISYDKLIPKKQKVESPFFIYAYIPKELVSQKQKLVQKLISVVNA